MALSCAGLSSTVAIPAHGNTWRVLEHPRDGSVRTNNLPLVFEKNGKQIEFSRTRRLIINLIGTTGSGKGTQGEKLARIYGIPHISVGDLFRDVLRTQSSLRSLIDHQIRLGPVYSVNELCLGIIARRLSEPDCVNGFILDGFPRSQIQSAVLGRTFLHPDDIHVPIFMDVSDATILDRLAHRWYCQLCNKQIRACDQVQVKDVCPTCSKPITKREDDASTDKIREKLDAFTKSREDIIQSIEERDPVHTLKLDDKDPGVVFSEICKIVDHTVDAQYNKSVENKKAAVGCMLLGILTMQVVSHLFGHKTF